MVAQHDPRGWLSTELRILAENTTHVVVAVRLDKTNIRRNLPFLCALADLGAKPGPAVLCGAHETSPARTHRNPPRSPFGHAGKRQR